MPQKIDPDATPGIKLLRLFRRLFLDGRRHYQQDLAEELHCSAQTIIRMISEIESVVGVALHSGYDNRRRWYQYVAASGCRTLGLNFEELRFLGICREMASEILPKPVLERLDASLEHLALHLADPSHTNLGKQFTFYAKGRIDYTPHAAHIEKLIGAAQERRVCLVRYKAPGRETAREHRFLPVRIAAMNNALYALGGQVGTQCDVVERPCNLAIHRVHDVIMTDKHLSFSLPEEGNSFGLPWHEPCTFTIRFSSKVAEYVRERVWADEQHMEDISDGGLLLTLTTRSKPELDAWVRSFGEDAVIVLQ